MIQTIKDIYDYRREDNSPMLSPFEPAGDIDFWKPYRDNFPYFDRLFMKKYRSWFPMDQEGDIEEVAIDFAYDVKSWLMINDKRYSELFRIQTIEDDEKYSLTDNVYEHEVIDKDTSSSGSNIKGQETITDTAENKYAAQSDSESKSRTIGQQSDSESKSLSVGQQSDSESKSLVHGQQVIDEDKSKTYGAATKTTENGTSAFNESGYSDTDRSVESDAVHTDTEDNSVTNGEHTDTETNSYTHGSHTDTETNSYTHGSHTDTETNSYTHGAHTDNLSNTRVDSQRTDTSIGTGSEDVERTRTGNIGVRTVDEMLNIHKDMWVDFSFYEMIFAEITRELLRGCC